MSAEQNRDPNAERELEELRRRSQQQTPPSARPGWRSFWLWPVAVVIIGLLWWGFWGGGWFWNRAHEGGNNVKPTPSNQLPVQNQNQPVAVTKPNSNNGAALLNAGNKQGYIGQSFEIVRTQILRKVNNSVFWLGAKNSAAPLLVVLANRAQNPKSTNLREGESVDVVGQVVKAPTPQDATQQWHLNHSGLERLEHEGAYLQASEASPLPKPPSS